MTWTWTVTTPTGRVTGPGPDPATAAGWAGTDPGPRPGQAEITIAGPELAPLRITVRGKWLTLHDPGGSREVTG